VFVFWEMAHLKERGMVEKRNFLSFCLELEENKSRKNKGER